MVQGKADACFDVVADHRDGDVIGVLGMLLAQRPGFQLAVAGEAIMQAGMRCQVAWVQGCAAFAQVLGRGYQAVLKVPEEFGAEPGIHRLPAAHHHIEAFADDIHHAVGEVQVQFNLWVQCHELGQCRHYQPGHLRHAHPQAPARRFAGLRQLLLGGFDFGKDAPAAFEEHRALGGEGDAACAAMEQAHAQAAFQARHALAHCRGTDPQ
ncbi:hypothetical protein D3C81_1323410 [compost metagenome]